MLTKPHELVTAMMKVRTCIGQSSDFTHAVSNGGPPPDRNTWLAASSSRRYDYEADEKIVDVFVHKVRSKLKRVGIGDAIETVWGTGYYLKPGARAALAAAVCQPWRGEAVGLDQSSGAIA